jgi:uncharacterized protein YjaZ
MNTYNINDWMYSPAKKGRPSDLGYYMGYKIVQSYYRNSKNKTKMIGEILNIKDFNDFLKASKYAEKLRDFEK